MMLHSLPSWSGPAAIRQWKLWPHSLRFGVSGIVGSVAAVFTTISLIPQLVRIWERRSAEDVSLGMFLLFSLGVFLWFIYGILIHSSPVVTANGISLLFSLTILILKLRFDRKEDPEK